MRTSLDLQYEKQVEETVFRYETRINTLKEKLDYEQETNQRLRNLIVCIFEGHVPSNDELAMYGINLDEEI